MPKVIGAGYSNANAHESHGSRDTVGHSLRVDDKLAIVTNRGDAVEFAGLKLYELTIHNDLLGCTQDHTGTFD
jgi:hypothetical protein